MKIRQKVKWNVDFRVSSDIRTVGEGLPLSGRNEVDGLFPSGLENRLREDAKKIAWCTEKETSVHSGGTGWRRDALSLRDNRLLASTKIQFIC